MTHVLIVGKKISSLTSYLTSHDLKYTFLQDISTTKFPEKRLKSRVLADFSSEQSLISTLNNLPFKPDALVAIYENYILPTAQIAKHFNLPGIPITAAQACTDKFIMRTLFNNSPEKISPDFATINSEADVASFANSHQFPLIMKPANLAKSLLVTKNDSLDELIFNYRKSTKLLPNIYKKYAPNREPKLIIEEFLEGSVHSVDAFVDNDGTPHILKQIVDYQTGYDIGYDDNFHYSRILPSKLDKNDQSALLHCAKLGVRALGMKSSPAHIEIIMTHKGPRIVEIGARNGGYRERMHKLANDIDITGATINLALGKEPNITAKRDDSCAVIELFPKAPGKFAGITEIDKLNELPSLNYLSIKAKPGEYVGKSSDGYKMCAVVILTHTDPIQFAKDKKYFDDHIHVNTTK